MVVWCRNGASSKDATFLPSLTAPPVVRDAPMKLTKSSSPYLSTYTIHTSAVPSPLLDVLILALVGALFSAGVGHLTPRTLTPHHTDSSTYHREAGDGAVWD